MNMAEYDKFMKSVEDKSTATQKQYRIQYNKLYKLLDKPVNETSENKILEIVKEQSNVNNQQALLNIGLVVRKLYGLSVKKLEDFREKNKKTITADIKKKNVELKETLPSYDDLIQYTEILWESSEWTDYIINYLLINYQVRNEDLDFTIIKRKKDANDTTKNYMWLQSGKVTYIRNRYKTDKTYGKKVNVITNKQFITAIRRVLGCQDSELKCGIFIPNKSSIAYYIIKATYKQLGEGKYVKIIINHFRKNLDKLKEISENRGTSLNEILKSYDIDNV
tara:strand:- start:223 stop:1059 length:837 start_codon:yes stop_codon:yes gene_type:complete